MAGDISLMNKLSTQMRYLTQRQATLSQNIANIDTPGYKARDLKPLDFADMASASAGGGKLAMRTTSPKHYAGIGGGMAGAFAAQENAATFETTPSKNNVVLDEEMAKISETGSNYQVASSLYRKFTAMYRTASGK